MDTARRGAHLLSLNRRSLRMDDVCEGFVSAPGDPGPAPVCVECAEGEPERCSSADELAEASIVCHPSYMLSAASQVSCPRCEKSARRDRLSVEAAGGKPQAREREHGKESRRCGGMRYSNSI